MRGSTAGRALKRCGIAAGLVSVLGATSLGIGAGPASAADMYMTAPFGVADFPTYFFGRTTICFDNHASMPIHQVFQLTTWLGYWNVIDVQPNSQQCVTRSWAGASVHVVDIGPSQGIPVHVYNQYGPS